MDHTPIIENAGQELASPTPATQPLKRRTERFAPQHTRILTKFFSPGGQSRMKDVIERILELSQEDVVRELDMVFTDFAHRHRRFTESLLRHYRQVSGLIPHGTEVSRERELLIGSYFTHEYSVSAAAMFNPSIVPHFDQTGLPPGAMRFIMSFRATGEGHISSVEFRSGMIDAAGDLHFDPASSFIEMSEVMIDESFDKRLFGLKLREIGTDHELYATVLEKLNDEFTLPQLEEAIRSIHRPRRRMNAGQREAIEAVLWLAASNYTVTFPAEHDISERVLFPISESESRGIEDARFVRFVDDDGTVTYYATYTAYNGVRILPQLIQTTDFVTFKLLTLNGGAVQNKGMALFPRRINGKYAMLGRQDGENLYIMFSDHIHFWYDRTLLARPHRPWEFIQIGNNGSPLETEAGWLVLTHGVGPMRKYSMACMLLDLDDPTKVIGRMNNPLLAPNTEERDGYVPNVVYTCGAMLHNDVLVIPYSMSDYFSGIATIPLADLLNELTR
ncbi:MAG: glycoside hydrolase family 130 protein [Bacteroidetes bacterium]|nr:glycoside hydrolase family 130 protein [Bacteroidota bacterium]